LEKKILEKFLIKFIKYLCFNALKLYQPQLENKMILDSIKKTLTLVIEIKEHLTSRKKRFIIIK
jgi:hypothetical protein